jgi:tRNA(His) 5'-end guanylyltransferase
MKGYEQATRGVLPRRTYTIIRVDMRAAHAYLRHAARPFDAVFMTRMDRTATELCQEITGAALAYTQSDEISVLVTDFATTQTQPWFGGGVQKIASIAAATTTAAFAAQLGVAGVRLPTFDARVFTIPDPVEVANYFVWRQRDCVRNSIQMAGQAEFSHRQLHGLNGAQVQELLWSERRINWNDYPDGAKRGRICCRTFGVTLRDEIAEANPVPRPCWVTEAAPHFTAQPGSFLAGIIPALPTLTPVAADA